MAIILEIKTNKSVFEFVTIFIGKNDIIINGEFDSANYGIGYDLEVRSAKCRLFDDIDTRDDDNPNLFIEIDRQNYLAPNIQSDILNYIRSIIPEQIETNQLMNK